MVTEIPDDEFLMSKRDFMLNQLMLGKVIKFLAEATADKTIPESEAEQIWIRDLTIVCRGELKALSPQQVDEFINQYHQFKQDKVDATIIKISLTA